MARKKKKEIQILENIEVVDFAQEGKSLARVDGKVIFIERAVPGDIVDIRLTKNKKDFAEAYIINITKKSEKRIDAKCEHFGVCGGCQWQVVTYKEQLSFKEKHAKDVIARLGKVHVNEWLPIARATHEYYYRNKIEYTFAHKIYEAVKPIKSENDIIDEKVMYAAGYHARGVFDKVVPITKCHLQLEPTNKVRQWLVNYCEQHTISLHDAKKHEGFLRNLQLRFCETGEKMVNIIVHDNDENIIVPMLTAFEKQFPEINQIFYTINNKWNDSIYDLTPINFKGPGFIIEKLNEFKFKIGPKSFFQTNTKQAEKLYSIVKEFASLTGGEVIYDLYCGTGSIGIFLSDKVKKIIGVETIAEAIDDAKLNAELNNLSNCHFFAGDVIKICDDAFFEKNDFPDIVITDPPRAGMHEKLIEKLLLVKSPKLIYVSCNVATQARDLALLSTHYEIVKMIAVDMFPQTHHIESVALLQLKN